jgi:hypothetical protein
MLGILHLLATFVGNLFRSRRRLEIENLFLRHPLNIAMTRAPRRLPLRGGDWASLAWITRVHAQNGRRIYWAMVIGGK